MDELSEHLRGDRDTITARQQLIQHPRSIDMMLMLENLGGYEESRVRAMRHTRASRISSYHSSRVPNGRRILPTLTGLMSRKVGLLLPSLSQRVLRINRSNFASSCAESLGTAFSISLIVLIFSN
jgi:hypothetical protein